MHRFVKSKYLTLEGAIEARIKAEIKLFGEFAAIK